MLDIVRESGLIRKVTRKVYWNTKFARLRTQIEEDDLVQMVFLKLLHRDNYKRYSERYPLVGFIYRVANGCAISYSIRKSTEQEWTLLDQPIDEESSRTILDTLVSEEPDIDLDAQYRINRVAASMDPEENPRVVIRYNDKETPFSIDALFDFFLETKGTKSEMRSHVINKKTSAPVTPTTFDKWWAELEHSARRELNMCL